ncbi:hypothetical protein FE840_014750 [Peteryoungia desertarenae]|uniref:Uncharacterized protein n=1 Tax=Peteryoungia desertarenae TaxID=1813451 RepID=A0ABX6QQY3_9HYPH|nr:hypothetical protein [Peteryoungia desertarenae]QLF70696.1 hypothetical protein FE840_014750 [Peteryoungia desertarenae]
MIHRIAFITAAKVRNPRLNYRKTRAEARCQVFAEQLKTKPEHGVISCLIPEASQALAQQEQKEYKIDIAASLPMRLE